MGTKEDGYHSDMWLGTHLWQSENVSIGTTETWGDLCRYLGEGIPGTKKGEYQGFQLEVNMWYVLGQ